MTVDAGKLLLLHSLANREPRQGRAGPNRWRLVRNSGDGEGRNLVVIITAASTRRAVLRGRALGTETWPPFTAPTTILGKKGSVASLVVGVVFPVALLTRRSGLEEVGDAFLSSDGALLGARALGALCRATLPTDSRGGGKRANN